MIENHEGFSETGAHYLPIEQDLKSLRQSVNNCQACHLCNDATQAVFGVGPENARLVLVGEQPGDREDIEGEPFVGPAGELLNASLRDAGIERRDIYLTNVVKHFKFERRGKRRLHKKPDSREIYACRPWLESELMALQPKTVICMGATAAQALLGRDFRLSQQRGGIQVTEWSERTIATWHPAAILRMPDENRKREMIEQFVQDLGQGNEIPE
jgi:DNA polymerase